MTVRSKVAIALFLTLVGVAGCYQLRPSSGGGQTDTAT